MKPGKLAILTALTLTTPAALATAFDASLLSTSDPAGADLSAFSREGYVAPGNYMLDIWLNNRKR
ncbi:TPA: FimD/PapC N-terminal domain-containing protein [Salmonella enterica]|uniref:FimD/PapC N-terminal domain-containing protein n=1 Tax=Salmonella sp. SG203 TaxID=2555397 RepID=UPI001581CBAA|nr:FimD/PapC N-terminal domain-containing protein [Salmonella sp. SG203]